MPTLWETLPLKFEGGWRTDLGRLDHGVQAPGSATILKNMEPSVDGGYRKMQGYAKWDAADVDPTEVGNVLAAIVVASDTVLALKGTTWRTSAGAGWTTALMLPVGGIANVHHDSFKFNEEKVVIVDGVNKPAYYTVVGGTMALDATAPEDVEGASLVRVFKNHVFFAKNNILTFTAPYDETDFEPGNGAGSINVGNDITGIVVFRDQLIIFTTDTIKRLSGNTSEDFVLSSITDRTGCLSAYSIQEVGGDILYLGPDGVRWLSATERIGDFGLERASSKIQSRVSAIIRSNPRYASNVIRGKNQYRLYTYIPGVAASISEGLIATKFSDQGATDISWARIIGMKVYHADSKQFPDREVSVFCSDTNYVYRMEFGNSFDGLAINAVFETPYMPINDPRVRKTVYKHTLYLKTSGSFNFQVNVRFDYNPSGSIQPPAFVLQSETGTGVWGQSTWGQFSYSAAVSDYFTNQVVGSGMVVALRYEDTSTNPPFTLDYALLEFGTNERR